MRSVLLSALSLLALDLGTTAVAPYTGLSLTAEADASDYRGRIRRIRLRERDSGADYGIAAETTGSTAGGTVDATLTDKATGLPIGSWTLGTPVRGAVVATADVGGVNLGDEITLAIEGDWTRGGDICVLSGMVRGRAMGASSSGWKASATQTDSGALKVVVRNEDKDWDGGNLTGLTVWSEDGTTGLAMALQGVGQERQRTIETDLSVYGEVALTATLTDADGVVVDEVTETVDLGGGLSDTDPSLALATLGKSPEGRAELTTCTLSGDAKAALEVDLVDDETGKSVLMTTDDSPVRSVEVFGTGLLAFEGDEELAGIPYTVTVQPYSPEGKALGEAYKAVLTVPKYDGGEVVYSAVPLTKGTAEVGFVRGEDGVAVVVMQSGDDPGAWGDVELTFEEPFEGPAPLESRPPVGSWGGFDQWVQVGEGAVPDRWTLTQALATPEGALIQSTTVSGAGTGEVYRTGGKGGDTESSSVLTVNVCHL